MSERALEPRNDLEHRLAAAQAGEIAPEVFMQELVEAQVFMPVQDEPEAIKGLQRSTRARPLVLQADDGTLVLVLFTSPERAKAFVREFPGYGGGLLTEFRWVLERVGDDNGIVINPGLELGIDMEPETVSQMMRGLSDPARYLES
jgi:hypothetical protein